MAQDINLQQYQSFQKHFYLVRKTTDLGKDVKGNYLIQSNSSKNAWRVEKQAFNTVRPPAFIINLEETHLQLQSELQNLLSQAQIIADGCASDFFISDDDSKRYADILTTVRTKQILIKLVRDTIHDFHSERDAKLLKLKAQINTLERTLSKLASEKKGAFTNAAASGSSSYDDVSRRYFEANTEVLKLGEDIDKLEEQTDLLDLFVVSSPAQAFVTAKAKKN